MPANRYMPKVDGISHGMAMPIAKSTEATTTGTLRRPMRSETGPEIKEPTRDITIMIMETTDTVTADSLTDWPM